MEHAIARLRADIDGALDDARRALAGVSAPPPLPLAASGGTRAPIGPRVSWKTQTERTAVEILLAPLLEAARGGAGRMRTVLDSHPEWIERLRERPPAPHAVREWWSALPPGTRTALINGAPRVTGALGGVPPLDRVAANRVTALDRLPSLEREIAHLEALSDEGAMATLRADRRDAIDRLRVEGDYLGRVIAGEVSSCSTSRKRTGSPR